MGVSAYSALHLSVRQMLQEHFPAIKVIENSFPKWMGGYVNRRLQLDFYIPSLGVAIEVQGVQHNQYIEYFHEDVNGFVDQQRRDRLKKHACRLKGVELLEIHKVEHLGLLKGYLKTLVPKNLRGVKSWQALREEKRTGKAATIRKEIEEIWRRRRKNFKRGQRRKPHQLVYNGQSYKVTGKAYREAISLCRADQVERYCAVIRSSRYRIEWFPYDPDKPELGHVKWYNLETEKTPIAAQETERTHQGDSQRNDGLRCAAD